MPQLDRRQFCAGAASTVAAAVLAGEARAAKQPASERLRVGCIGVAGRAGFLLRAFAAHPEVELVAVADVDQRHFPEAIEAVRQITGKKPQTHGDFRAIIDDSSIDAVAIGTPDHWHAIPTILACLAGKDVYVEKPDGHNMLEGQRMVEAMRKEKRIVQLGTQSRSAPHFHEAVEYVRSGKLGRVLAAKAWEATQQGSIGHPPDSDPPEGVDYDMWLGPAPKRPFNVRRFHGNWRWFFDYGTGDIGNDGVHRLDYALWAMSAASEAQGDGPLYMPEKISAVGGKWYFDDMQQWPDTLQASYEFAGQGDRPGKVLTYEMRLWNGYGMEGEGEGAAVYGDQGYLVMSNGRWRVFNRDREVVAQGQGGDAGSEHIDNFIQCVKSRQRPTADLETVGHRASVLCHAANVAWRVGRQLTLDAQSETFVGDAEANALRTREEYRKPWTLPEV